MNFTIPLYTMVAYIIGMENYRRNLNRNEYGCRNVGNGCGRFCRIGDEPVQSNRQCYADEVDVLRRQNAKIVDDFEVERQVMQCEIDSLRESCMMLRGERNSK